MEAFIEIFDIILSGDNKQLSECNETLLLIANDKPKDFIDGLLKIIFESENKFYISESLIILKNMIFQKETVVSSSMFGRLWTNIKSHFSQIIQIADSDESICNLLSHMIGNVIQMQNADIDDFNFFIISVFEKTFRLPIKILTCAFKLYRNEQYKIQQQIFQIITSESQDEETFILKINLLFECYPMFAKIKNFTDLFISIPEMLNQNLIEWYLEKLGFLCEEEPHLIGSIFEMLIPSVCSLITQIEHCPGFCHIIECLAENTVFHFQKNIELLQTIVGILFNTITTASFPDDWAEDDPTDPSSLALEALRAVNVECSNFTLPIIDSYRSMDLSVINTLYAYLSSFSTLRLYFFALPVEQVTELFDFFLPFITEDNHPKIRYAAYNALANLIFTAKNISDQILTSYYNSFLEVIQNGFNDIHVEVNKGFLYFVNTFLQNVHKEDHSEHSQEILETLAGALISAHEELVDPLKLCINTYISTCPETLRQIFGDFVYSMTDGLQQSHGGKNSIAIIAIISACCAMMYESLEDKSQLVPYIQVGFDLYDSEIDTKDQDDLCETLVVFLHIVGSSNKDLESELAPRLIRATSQELDGSRYPVTEELEIPEGITKVVDGETAIYINTSSIEEVRHSLFLLIHLVMIYGSEFSFQTECVELYASLISESPVESVRILAHNLLEKLIDVISNTNYLERIGYFLVSESVVYKSVASNILHLIMKIKEHQIQNEELIFSLCQQLINTLFKNIDNYTDSIITYSKAMTLFTNAASAAYKDAFDRLWEENSDNLEFLALLLIIGPDYIIATDDGEHYSVLKNVIGYQIEGNLEMKQRCTYSINRLCAYPEFAADASDFFELLRMQQSGKTYDEEGNSFLTAARMTMANIILTQRESIDMIAASSVLFSEECGFGLPLDPVRGYCALFRLFKELYETDSQFLLNCLGRNLKKYLKTILKTRSLPVEIEDEFIVIQKKLKLDLAEEDDSEEDFDM